MAGRELAHDVDRDLATRLDDREAVGERAPRRVGRRQRAELSPELLFDAVDQPLVEADEDRERVVVVLRLSEQIGGDQRRVHVRVREHRELARSREHVDRPEVARATEEVGPMKSGARIEKASSSQSEARGLCSQRSSAARMPAAKAICRPEKTSSRQADRTRNSGLSPFRKGLRERFMWSPERVMSDC